MVSGGPFSSDDLVILYSFSREKSRDSFPSYKTYKICLSFTVGRVWVLEGGQVGKEPWKGPHEGTVLVRVTLGGSVFMVLSPVLPSFRVTNLLRRLQGFFVYVDKF